MLKIGILLAEPSAESKKDEMANVNSTKREWLKLFDSVKHKKLSVIKDSKRCVAGDTSTGFCILAMFNNVEVDFILPEEINPSRLRKNHINFMLIYDLLESFHTDKTGKKFKALQETLRKCKNIYPPYEYQVFINNKCSYIKHLNKNNLEVIPTFCIMNKTKMPTNVNDDFVKQEKEKLVKYINKEEWGKFIGKPVYGQESSYFSIFKKSNSLRLEPYIKKGLAKYPGLIFQKYIEGFDKENPEIRLYFIGKTYRYSVVTTNTKVSMPKEEGGTLEIKPFKELKVFARNIVDKLPKLEMNGKTLPRLLTRIDISCQKDFNKPWYVNEVEFVPSLYIQDVNFIPEIWLATQMIDIAKKFIE